MSSEVPIPAVSDIEARFNALEKRIRDHIEDSSEVALRPDLLAGAITAVLDLDFVEFEVIEALAGALGVREDQPEGK